MGHLGDKADLTPSPLKGSGSNRGCLTGETYDFVRSYGICSNRAGFSHPPDAPSKPLQPLDGENGAERNRTAVRNTGVSHLVRGKPDSFIVAADQDSRRVGITEPKQAETIDAVAIVSGGLEGVAADELAALGARGLRPLQRAVSFQVDRAGFYRLHLQARLPFRILRQMARFPCRSREELYAGIQQCLDWQSWLPPSRSFRVDVTGSSPGLRHSHFCALQAKNALIDLQQVLWGERSSINLQAPDLVLHLHLGGNHASLSFDSSTTSLHRRGYRAAMGLAPLKENLAAGLIDLTGWNGQIPLADPLCGSGTLLIEAASKQLGHAPGLGLADVQQAALQQWPDFNAALWRQELDKARALAVDHQENGTKLAPILGMDQEASVINQAQSNIASANVANWIEIRQGDFRDFHPPEGPGIIVCNPPYGKRLGDINTLEELYSDLGAMAKQRCSGWQLWLLSGNPTLTRALRMKASRRIPVSNGGMDCRWLRYDIH